MPLNFSDALSSVKRKAQLQGRPLSRQETAGIAEGYSENASARLTRQNALKLEKERIDLVKKQHQDRLAQREKDRKAAKKASRQQTGASVGGAVGTVVGAALGGPYAPIGAVLGGLIGNECIVITACTTPDSYEVNIARKYRDEYMTHEQLGGYYAMGVKLVPLIHKHSFIKKPSRNYRRL